MAFRPSSVLAPILLLSSGLASAQIVPGTTAVVFSVNDAATSFSGSSGTSLADMKPTDLVHFAPFVNLSAEKIQANPVYNVMMGDEDGDGDFAENFIGAIDAVQILRNPVEPTTLRTVYRYVFSTSEDFDIALDGDVFRFLPGGPAGDSIQRMLREGQIRAAIGDVSQELDVDAFTQDIQGNLFLSFAEDEVVNGTPVGDGGVVLLPASAITYGTFGEVTSLAAGSAVVILDEPDVDAMVAQSGLTFASTVDDLTCLEVDLMGGTFVGKDGQNHPNLYFSGESLGATILTTANGGSFATGNFGFPLATPVQNPGNLGLGSITGGVDALTIREDYGRALTIEVPDDEVNYPAETHIEWNIGNCVPDSMVLVLIDVYLTSPGARPTSTYVAGKAFPQIYPFPVAWNLVFMVPSDSNGVATLQGTLTHSVLSNLLIAQAYDPGLALFGFPEQLGAPGGIHFP